MAVVLPEEREAAFRGVVGSDKFGAKVKDAHQQSPHDSETEEGEEKNSDEEDPRLAEEKAGSAGKVVFWWMELHPRVTSELLWETRARVLVDFTCGAGMAIKAALTLGVKCVGICNNSDHVKLLACLLREWIKQKLEEKNQMICPADLWKDIAAAKDQRLVMYESQKRKANSDANEQDSKKTKSATTLDSIVSSIVNASPPKTPAPQGALAPHGIPASTPKAATAKPGSPGKASSPKAASSPKESPAQLKDMLKAWSK